ncbi:MAG: alpha/beta hydrolase [Blastococcus sp.]
MAARLAAVAAWDVSSVRGGVASLAAVAARLAVWRMRVDAVARALEAADCWSGPAARSAAAALGDVSDVATVVRSALAGSQEDLERMAGASVAAQDLAVEALALRAALPAEGSITEFERLSGVLQALVPGAAAPVPGPAVALSLAAVERAEAVTRAARAAGEALARVTAGHLVAPATFDDLAGRIALVGPVQAPGVPALRTPAAVAAWWAGLSERDQRAVIRSAPAEVGALDGVPAWARDLANRMVLQRALDDPGTPPYAAFGARVLVARLDAEEAAGRCVQVQTLDLAGDRVVLALGDLDTADAVAVVVPGMANTIGDDVDSLVGSATAVGIAARAAAPGLAVTAVVWLGYRTPTGPPGVASRAAARRGGAALDTALDGLAAARAASGTPPPRTTVVAHSYGTVVVDDAARRPGRLAADAVVLLGSPGMRGRTADLEAPEVYDAATPADPVSWLGWFGTDTWAPDYGATELPTVPSMHHSDYLDPGRPTLTAIGEVVAGRRSPD